MNRKRWTSVAAALAAAIALFPAGAGADDAVVRTLTWDDCVRLALETNPDLGAARSSREAGVADYRGSFNGLMPSLVLSNSHNDSNALSRTLGADKWSAQASASVNFFSASAIANIRSSSASLLQAEATLRRTSADVRFNLRSAFAQMIFAQKSLEVARLICGVRDKDSQLVSLRYQSGRESKGNMMRAAAQLVQAEADLAQARRNLRIARTGLDRQLGFDRFDVIAVTGTLDAAAAPETIGDEVALIAHRPDVALSEAEVKSAEAAVRSAESSLWPTLTGSYTRSRLGSAEFPAASYGWTTGLTLSLPLFSGGPTAAYYAVSAGRRNLEKAEQNLRSTRDAAIVDLETNWADYAAADDQVKVQRALLQAARQRNDEADVRYASGLLTYDNWEIIASDRIGTEKQAISSEFNAAVAQAAWDKSLGKELGE